MIHLTNPFSDSTLHFELQSRWPLSRFISRTDRENRAIDAVARVIKIRADACESMKPIFYEAVGDLAKRPCFLAEKSLTDCSDMLFVAAKFMDVFNECLAVRIAANPVMQDTAKSTLESILDEDFSLDPIPQSGAVPIFHSSVVFNRTFWEEQKVVQDLLEFSRE
jgi:hypothetical protein